MDYVAEAIKVLRNSVHPETNTRCPKTVKNNIISNHISPWLHQKLHVGLSYSL